MAGIVHEVENTDLLAQVRQESAAAARQLAEAARLHKGQIVVVGCSTSEVVGHRVGSWSTPEIAQAIAAPLAKTEKIVIVDNGSTNGEGARGASKVTNYVTDIIGQLPETVEALTGYNLMDVFKKKGQSAQPPAADSVEAAQEAEPAE